jgi:hypothetical protein
MEDLLMKFASDQGVLNKFEIFLLIFITLQPIIDVLTTISLQFFSEAATFGVFLRFLVMFACMVYILLYQVKNRKSKILIYLIGLAIVLAINLGVNFFMKDQFILMDEVKFLGKIVYAQIMLFTYLILFKKVGKSSIHRFIKYVLYALLVYDLVMVISIATNTSLTAYDWTKIGFTGWFYAANDLGAILAILFPICLMIAIKKTIKMSSIYYWIPVLLTAFSLLMLGTKVGYGALLIGLLAAVVTCWISWFRKRDKMFLTNGIISIVFFFVLIVITPFTPFFTNTFAHMQLLGITFDNPEEPAPDAQAPPKKTSPHVNKKQVENLILSSREDYLAEHQRQFAEAPLAQKLFGMGYSGNYSKEPKMIEMDFYDLFYSLGIIGFIAYIGSFLFILLKTAMAFLKNIKLIFEPNYIFILVSLLLGLGISYTAGHVLTAPSVSIFFGAILALLYVEIKNHPNES